MTRQEVGPSVLALAAAFKLAQRYEMGHTDTIRTAIETRAGGDHEFLNSTVNDLLGLARRELSVRLAASDSLMQQDVSVLLARTVIAAHPAARTLAKALNGTRKVRPHPATWELLVAVVTVAFVHEHASTPEGAAKLQQEINYIATTLNQEL